MRDEMNREARAATTPAPLFPKKEGKKRNEKLSP